MEIRVELLNHEETIEWVNDKEVTGEKLHRIIRQLALEGESSLKKILNTRLKEPTGATAASVEAWGLEVGTERVSYAVGSRARGKILRWLDRGRGPVYPIRAKVLRFWINKQKIFAAHVGPAPALNVMHEAATEAMGKLDQIVERELK